MRRFRAALAWPLALLSFALLGAPARAETTTAPQTQNAIIELNAAHGAGTPGTTDKVVLENLRVVGRQATSYGGGVFGWTTTESVYNVTYRFDPATLRLVPETYVLVSTSGGGTGGGASTCASLSVKVVDSLVGATGPIAGATIAIQSQTAQTDATGVASVTGMPSGQSVLTVSAPGYGTITQTAELFCDTANELSVALSPGSGPGALGPGEFRVVLTWGRNPEDLDSHLTGPLGASSSRFHLFYANPEDGTCGLDVDDISSFGPETVTCPRTSSTGLTVVPGVYRYSVHHYSGSSNIGASGAIVRLEQGDGTTQYFFPPATGWEGKVLWVVFEITVAADGATTVNTLNTISADTTDVDTDSGSLGAARRRPDGGAALRNLPAKTGRRTP